MIWDGLFMKSIRSSDWNFLWPSCLLSRTVYFSKIICISPKLKISRLIILLFNIILWCVVFKWGCHLPAILCIFHFPTLACTLFPVLKDLPIVAPEWPLIREWDLKKELSTFSKWTLHSSAITDDMVFWGVKSILITKTACRGILYAIWSWNCPFSLEKIPFELKNIHLLGL